MASIYEKSFQHLEDTRYSFVTAPVRFAGEYVKNAFDANGPVRNPIHWLATNNHTLCGVLVFLVKVPLMTIILAILSGTVFVIDALPRLSSAIDDDDVATVVSWSEAWSMARLVILLHVPVVLALGVVVPLPFPPLPTLLGWLAGLVAVYAGGLVLAIMAVAWWKLAKATWERLLSCTDNGVKADTDPSNGNAVIESREQGGNIVVHELNETDVDLPPQGYR